MSASYRVRRRGFRDQSSSCPALRKILCWRAAERLAEHRDERVDRIVAQFGRDLLDAGAARQLA